MFKHAFLILVHHTDHIDYLIEQLGGNTSIRTNIYVHVDKKVWNKFRSIMAKYPPNSNVYFFTRYDVHWGGVQMIDAERALLELALKDEENFYFHLLSGVDFLCRPLNELIAFFDAKENQNKEYIECAIVSDIWTEERIRSRFFCWNIHDLIDTRKWHLGLVNRFFSHLQWALHIRRGAFPYSTLFGGSQWWSLSRKGASVLFKALNTSCIRSRFCYTYAPDEIVASTVIGNSDLSIVNEKCLRNMKVAKGEVKSLRYIPWWNKDSGKIYPLTLTEDDYDLIKNSGAFFCRKIDLKISKVLMDKLAADMKLKE